MAVKIKVLIVAIVLAFSFTQIAIAQESKEIGKAQADRWRGLILDQSTPEDAIKVLGQPKNDGPGNIYASSIQSWLSAKYRPKYRFSRDKKVFRNLDFEKIDENVNKATLHFLDGKLVFIDIFFKERKDAPTRESLPLIYGIAFEPVADDRPFFQPGSDPNHHWTYPECHTTCLYGMVGVTERSIVLGNMISDRLFSVSLISRTLQNKDGLDALK